MTGAVDRDFAPLAGRLVAEFYRCYPDLILRFEDPDRPAPRRITLVVKEDITFGRGTVPAYCSGDTITVSRAYLSRRPDDTALLTHELTHAVQAYRRAPGWMTEGLADYARHVYGPEKQPGWALPTRLAGRNYDDSYRVTGRFLLWLNEKHPGSVDTLHDALQAGTFTEADFETVTGTPVAELWAACVAEVSGE